MPSSFSRLGTQTGHSKINPMLRQTKSGYAAAVCAPREAVREPGFRSRGRAADAPPSSPRRHVRRLRQPLVRVRERSLPPSQLRRFPAPA
jgi:hypothetical protein